MARFRFPSAPAAATLLLCGCATPTAAPEPARADQLARALVAAEPPVWHQAAPPVIALGAPGAPAVIRAIRADRHAPGEQIAVATLGALGSASAIPLLEEILRERSPTSGEAALALGQLPSPGSADLLAETVADPSAGTVARTASACALLDLGEVDQSVPFLCAVLVAGTPEGLETNREFGLRDKTRWALERYMVIEAIRRHSGGESFGLDPDNPWPDLVRNTTRFRDAMRGGR